MNTIPKLPSVTPEQATLSVNLVFGRTIEFQLFPTDDLGEIIGSNWLYEPEVISAILNLVGEGDFCVDAGACLGYHSLLMSRVVGSSGAVMAFEPDPYARKKMAANLELNEVKNIHLLPIPLLDKVDNFCFFSFPDWCGYSSFINYTGKGNSEKLMMKTSFLDKIFDDECTIKLLKIDCEGVEHKILNGADRLLSRGAIDYLIVEFNFDILRRLKLSHHDMRNYMAAKGYECYYLYQHGLVPEKLPHGYDIELKDPQRFHYNFLFARKELPEWKQWSARQPVWISPYAVA